MAKTPAQDYAPDDGEAAKRAADWIDADPYPDIAMALLTAAHIKAYVQATGMLFPFDDAGLKSASYEMALRGEVIWWNDDKVKQRTEVKARSPSFIDLPPNSITFVQVEPLFRLPRYMAIRFNLRIALVHRGILLGTGPLVDPGFEGRLLIPLHNLTATVCRLDLKKALIWVEFTKTTYGSPPGDHSKNLFPPEGKNLSPEEYLYKASLGEPILSSIPQATKLASERAVAAEEEAKKSASSLGTIRNVGILVVLTVVGGIASIVYNSLSLSGTLSGQMSTLNQNMVNMQKDLGLLATRVTTLEGKTATDAAKADADGAALAKSMADLGARVDELGRHAATPPPAFQPAPRPVPRPTAKRRRR